MAGLKEVFISNLFLFVLAPRDKKRVERETQFIFTPPFFLFCFFCFCVSLVCGLFFCRSLATRLAARRNDRLSGGRAAESPLETRGRR